MQVSPFIPTTLTTPNKTTAQAPVRFSGLAEDIEAKLVEQERKEQQAEMDKVLQATYFQIAGKDMTGASVLRLIEEALGRRNILVKTFSLFSFSIPGVQAANLLPMIPKQELEEDPVIGTGLRKALNELYNMKAIAYPTLGGNYFNNTVGLTKTGREQLAQLKAQGAK